MTCSGLHGANRLASNSLLEGLVYGHRVAKALEDVEERVLPGKIPDWDIGSAVPSDEEVVVSQNWDEIRRFMWNYVGIVRGDKRLRRAARRIALLKEEIREYYWAHLVNRDMLELRNIADVADLIVQCAIARKESPLPAASALEAPTSQKRGYVNFRGGARRGASKRLYSDAAGGSGGLLRDPHRPEGEDAHHGSAHGDARRDR